MTTPQTPERVYMAAPPMPYYLESGETRYGAGDLHPSRKQLGVFDLLIVESGCLYIGEEEHSWSLSSGETLLLMPDGTHYSVKPCEMETVFYWVHFHVLGEWLQSCEEHSSFHHEAHAAKFLTAPYALTIRKQWTLPYPEQAYQLARRMNRSAGEPQSSAFWTQQQAFEELLRMMDMRQNEAFASPVVALAEKAEAYIKNNYREAISGNAMAAELNFHYNYISRCMKQVYGMTPGQYWNAYRLEQAKLLLLKTEWTIGAIAEQVGYDSAAYFTSCMTKKIGLSPTAFRKQFSR
ncbi:AraC family transcriptional regulator [Paenibacillus sp. HB172176]|uniref:helix-turn-helix domain-containing protein n=1 Tax=Paenibacillus sp. HB172176 TaxID=2493690 RepID=UPI00197CE319|nr:AraC family transcriptional regulator [Paenibacillus sp. HB172176]